MQNSLCDGLGIRVILADFVVLCFMPAFSDRKAQSNRGSILFSLAATRKRPFVFVLSTFPRFRPTLRSDRATAWPVGVPSGTDQSPPTVFFGFFVPENNQQPKHPGDIQSGPAPERVRWPEPLSSEREFSGPGPGHPRPSGRGRCDRQSQPLMRAATMTPGKQRELIPPSRLRDTQ